MEANIKNGTSQENFNNLANKVPFSMYQVTSK